jgi:hypothetical protein
MTIGIVQGRIGSIFLRCGLTEARTENGGDDMKVKAISVLFCNPRTRSPKASEG